jgi:hypothetical protein
VISVLKQEAATTGNAELYTLSRAIALGNVDMLRLVQNHASNFNSLALES